MSIEKQKPAPRQSAVMCSAFYEVYHRADNNYVVWCKRELMAIDLFIFPDVIRESLMAWIVNLTYIFKRLNSLLMKLRMLSVGIAYNKIIYELKVLLFPMNYFVNI